jgi:hypothetical protein
MPSWGYLIVIAALYVGLRQSIPTRHQPFLICAIVVIAVAYAAVRQHAY